VSTLQAERTDYNKVNVLLKILEKRGDEFFDSFLLALRETGQNHIAERLEENVGTR
jgi:Caspase recruitment domain